MKDSYDFSNAKRGPVLNAGAKTRITIHIDSDILDAFREKAAKQGKGYQTIINETLRLAVTPHSEPEPVTEEVLRRVIREELKAA
jgi:uncharacterized protein (DUF4415 family)